MRDYDKQTGDGAWLAASMAIFIEAIKKTEAETPAEPQKTMRSGVGADLGELRLPNCRR